MNKQYDVVIIGAGLSGIGMACQLSQHNPDKSFTILERRQSLGGTWDLFRYPGIRSDSDVISFGFDFNPWNSEKVLASGESIKSYIRQTAEKFGVAQKIQYGIKILSADFSTQNNQWSILAIDESSGESCSFSCNYLISATGYYNHDQGYTPQFKGIEDYHGQVVHPQNWPENLNYKNKNVVVIGSGATAVTLIPSMADDTAHITMLQRSPSYVINVPNTDSLINMSKKLLPESVVYKLFRKRNIFLQRGIYKISRRFPKQMRSFLLSNAHKQLGKDFDMTHFTPSYMPWDERLCAIPDNDLFNVIRQGKASVVTDQIDHFDASGIVLKSGKKLLADIIVTATGLELQLLGGIQISVDDEVIQLNQKMSYKGTLIEGVPNFSYLFGYTNAPWTLKIGLSCQYICRLIKELDVKGMHAVKAVAPQGESTGHSIVYGMQSGYIQRGDHVLPRQGKSAEWFVSHNLEKDIEMYNTPIESPHLRWTKTVMPKSTLVA